MSARRLALVLSPLLALLPLAVPAQSTDEDPYAMYDTFDPAAYDLAAGQAAYQTGGLCLQCHGWDGAGLGKNPRSPGVASNLRETPLDAYYLREVIACGRPGTPMPYHDDQAYRDDRCYGMLLEDFDESDTPDRGRTLDDEEIANLVAYILTSVAGQGETTLADCEAFYRPGHRNCRGLTN